MNYPKMPDEVAKALHAMTDEEIVQANDVLVRIQRPLAMVGMMQGGLSSEQIDRTRSMIGGAGMLAGIIGTEGLSAGLCLIAQELHANPMALVAESKLVRDGDKVIFQTTAPSLEEAIAKGQVIEIGDGPDEDDDGDPQNVIDFVKAALRRAGAQVDDDLPPKSKLN
jgi:hypothetical protein